MVQRVGGVGCQLLEQRPKIIRAVISKDVESVFESVGLIFSVAVVDSPRAVFSNQQGVGWNIQPGGNAIQGVKVDFPGGAQGLHFRWVKTCALLQFG